MHKKCLIEMAFVFKCKLSKAFRATVVTIILVLYITFYYLNNIEIFLKHPLLTNIVQDISKGLLEQIGHCSSSRMSRSWSIWLLSLSSLLTLKHLVREPLCLVCEWRKQTWSVSTFNNVSEEWYTIRNGRDDAIHHRAT